VPNAYISGTGAYVPPRVVTNDDLRNQYGIDTTHEWIVQRTGIEARRFSEEGQCSADLALPAAERAIERAGLQKTDLDMIVFATLSPKHAFPGDGVLLQQKLGLCDVGRFIPALDVRNQCSGFLYSLSVADAWVRCGVYKNVLIVGSEVHSTGVEFTERGRDVAVLFGDGAGAVLVGEATRPEQGVRSLELHADGSGAYDLWLEAPASKMMPRLTHEMLDAGKHYPAMNGKQVFRWATEKMPEVAHSVVKAAGFTMPEIDMFVPHQANMRINQMVAAKLGIPEDRVVHNIEVYGNTTAATIPIGLSESWRAGKIGAGSKVLMAAFGAGFTWGGAVAVF
jgi:3-oxoacyl-[acyl-carrier-protein] synthase-3